MFRLQNSSVFKNWTIFHSVCSDFGHSVVKTGSKPVLFRYQTFWTNQTISNQTKFCSVVQTKHSVFGRSLYLYSTTYSFWSKSYLCINLSCPTVKRQYRTWCLSLTWGAMRVWHLASTTLPSRSTLTLGWRHKFLRDVKARAVIWNDNKQDRYGPVSRLL